MSLMILTLCANVLIMICFKLFPKFEVINLNAIVVNYFTAVLTGVIVLGEIPFGVEAVSEPWFPYALFLGVIFVTIFNVVALTIQKTGVVIGSLFQKMSLLFPVVAAMLFFGEEVVAMRVLGIALAVLSIIIINLPSGGKDGEVNALRKYWYLPLLTLLGLKTLLPMATLVLYASCFLRQDVVESFLSSLLEIGKLEKTI